MAKMRPGALVEGLSGTLGNAVVVRYRDGRVNVRQRVTPRDPNTPAQTAARARLAQAARLFRTLTPEEALAWQAYARREAERPTTNRQPPDPRAQSAFVRLATKVLQIDPAAPVPSLPPAAEFLGESFPLTVTTVPGALRFTAQAPNSPGITTELLLQPLRTSLSRPDPAKYRTQAFVRFEPGVLSFDVEVGSDWYSAAYRFVVETTGQVSDTVVTPVVRVTAS